ncbi:hypothetical protein OS493_040030 [Desmophyllum pertusum]|uniref:Uncharacterized protein n=1 Tax=Desmophyllum pertusum TaxID=174260 RepID=A0A9X0D5Y4_9CNID|nr:hypothetical protein OS493_040030 [Desmophyllum pertusum]
MFADEHAALNNPPAEEEANARSCLTQKLFILHLPQNSRHLIQLLCHPQKAKAAAIEQEEESEEESRKRCTDQ